MSALGASGADRSHEPGLLDRWVDHEESIEAFHLVCREPVQKSGFGPLAGNGTPGQRRSHRKGRSDFSGPQAWFGRLHMSGLLTPRTIRYLIQFGK